MPTALDIAGLRFGRLVVVSRTHVPQARNAMWRCKCDCGNETIAAAANLGKTTMSCGCLAKETAAALLRENLYTKTHGMSHTPEHSAWTRMQQRCYNPKNKKYKDYGGRGITVCQRWLNDFRNFYEDMGPKPSPKHSIDRKNNNGNYEKDNCHWTINRVQSINTRFNRIVEIGDRKLCVRDWCVVLGVPDWMPYEMVAPGGKDRDQPSPVATVEDAINILYERLKAGKSPRAYRRARYRRLLASA